MKLGEWIFAAVIIGAAAIYGLGQVAKKNRDELDARLDAQAAVDGVILNTCREAAAKRLGTPVLDWNDALIRPATKTTTGYRVTAMADTGGTLHVFTCYIGNDMRSLQQITER